MPYHGVGKRDKRRRDAVSVGIRCWDGPAHAAILVSPRSCRTLVTAGVWVGGRGRGRGSSGGTEGAERASAGMVSRPPFLPTAGLTRPSVRQITLDCGMGAGWGPHVADEGVSQRMAAAASAKLPTRVSSSSTLMSTAPCWSSMVSSSGEPQSTRATEARSSWDASLESNVW